MESDKKEQEEMTSRCFSFQLESRKFISLPDDLDYYLIDRNNQMLVHFKTPQRASVLKKHFKINSPIVKLKRPEIDEKIKNMKRLPALGGTILHEHGQLPQTGRPKNEISSDATGVLKNKVTNSETVMTLDETILYFIDAFVEEKGSDYQKWLYLWQLMLTLLPYRLTMRGIDTTHHSEDSSWLFYALKNDNPQKAILDGFTKHLENYSKTITENGIIEPIHDKTQMSSYGVFSLYSIKPNSG